MLEHGQLQNDFAGEVSCDRIVQRDILLPYIYGSFSRSSIQLSTKTLNSLSPDFLVHLFLIFQYYTDFVTLYDTISFSQPLFAHLLLFPPRLCAFLLSRFYPATSENTCAQSKLTFKYLVHIRLSSLLHGKLQEFIRWVALHQVAANIWPDFQEYIYMATTFCN